MSVTSPTHPENGGHPPYPVRQFSVEEYHRLGETGVLSEADRLELLEGWIVPKMIRNPIHDVAVSLVDAALRSRLAADWVVRVQSAITTDDSEPEPNVAVVRGPIRRYVEHHPQRSEVALVVEVADTSFDRDCLRAAIYARAGIPHYWIINLAAAKVEVYSRPPRPAPDGVPCAYAAHVSLGPVDDVPLIMDEQQVAVIPAQELLP